MKLDIGLGSILHSSARALGFVRRIPEEAPPADFLAAALQQVRDSCEGVAGVDAGRIAALLVAASSSRLPAHVLAELACKAAAQLIAEEPAYSQVATRLFMHRISREAAGGGALTLLRSLQRGRDAGVVNARVLAFAEQHTAQLAAAIDESRTQKLDYFGLCRLYERFLLRARQGGEVIETPQYCWMRIAISLSVTLQQALDLYEALSNLHYLPSEEILLHAGSDTENLSSCYLLDSPRDSGNAIEERFGDIALLSRSSADIAVAWNHVRTEGSLIHPAARSALAAAARPAAQCVFLEPWHSDIQSCLAAQEEAYLHDATSAPLTVANWVPDLFMRRVEAGESWSLFDPEDVPQFAELFGDAFDRAYAIAEQSGLAVKSIPARALYEAMLRTIAHTGHGWIEFKDKCNRACNQTATQGNVVHVSNLCTEILAVTSKDETAVCSLGVINLAQHVVDGGFDFARLARSVDVAIRQLDRTIELDAYPLASARSSSMRWRPVGLGLMGLQDVFFKLRLPFDSYDARQLSTKISEAIYFHALSTSLDLAKTHGAHTAFADTRVARDELQFDAWGVTPSEDFDWGGLRDQIAVHGLRNSLLVAIGPTASLSAIAGCFESIEPQTSNIQVRTTHDGDFVQLNPCLVADLRQLGCWSEATRTAMKLAGGSIQGLYQLPGELRTLYRTAWELSALALIDLAADRGAFVDQSQSLSLYLSTSDVSQIDRIYSYAWKCGLKTVHLLHTSRRPGFAGGYDVAE